MLEFLNGVTFATFLAAGVFFVKFYRDSRDRFFLYFALACWFIATERIAILFVNNPFSSLRSNVTETHVWIYLIRALSFLMILIAIIEKNRKRS